MTDCFRERKKRSADSCIKMVQSDTYCFITIHHLGSKIKNYFLIGIFFIIFHSFYFCAQNKNERVCKNVEKLCASTI